MSEQDQDFEFLLESRLTGFAVYLTEVSETDDGYELIYESIAADQASAIPHREVGRIVNVFRDITDDPVEIEATVQNMDGTTLGTWHAPRKWLVALESGELTELEFSEKVVSSIEPAGQESP